MKKINIYLLACLLISLISCNDVLDDVENLSAFEPSKVWSNEILANAYLNDLYAGTMPSWPKNGHLVDECGPGIVANEMVTAQNNNFKPWTYSTIRKINILLQEIQTGTLEDDVKNNIIGQAHFLRAWHYFNMLKNYGGVPIIKIPQDLKDEEALKVSRNSSLECFNFIIEDLDEALKHVPNRSTGENYGRIDKAAVYAFKTRVYLRKASPQFNPKNPYDNTYWKEAYDACVLAKTKLTEFGFALHGKYEELFSKEGNDECIMATVYINPGKTNGRGENGARPLSESKNATGTDQPIWDMVEAFTMKDGKTIDDATSAYSYDTANYWENRDPRFYANIVYNGALFELSGKAGRRQYNTYDLVPSGIASHLDIFGDKQAHGRTGFYPMKGIEKSLLSTESFLNSTDWVEIRYAEILLNLAEAANETGKSSDALDLVKEIRKRAGIEAGTNNMYGVKTGLNREQVRDLILAERRVEFMYEGKRLQDLIRHRRWHLLDGNRKYGLESFLKQEFLSGDTLMTNSDGLYINKTNTITRASFLPEDFEYKVREVLGDQNKEMVVPEKYYFMPIRTTDIEKNENLEQTKGWDEGTFNPTLD